MSRQRTIQNEAELSGRGLFTGLPVTVRFKPAPVDAGVSFVRADQANPVAVKAVAATSSSDDIRITGVNWNLDSSDFTKVDRVDLTFAAVTNHDAEFTIRLVLKKSGGAAPPNLQLWLYPSHLCHVRIGLGTTEGDHWGAN